MRATAIAARLHGDARRAARGCERHVERLGARVRRAAVELLRPQLPGQRAGALPERSWEALTWARARRSGGASRRSGRSCVRVGRDRPGGAPAGEGGVGRRPAAHREAAPAAGVFDYIDGGAEDERTLAANPRAFAGTGFRPRVLRGLRDGRDPAPRVLGRAASPTRWCWRPPASPASPTRRASWPWPAPRERAGLPYTLSTLSTRSIEEVRAVSDGRLLVPGLRLARPRPGRGDDPAGGRGRLRGAGAHRRHRGVRPPRARRAPRASRCRR